MIIIRCVCCVNTVCCTTCTCRKSENVRNTIEFILLICVFQLYNEVQARRGGNDMTADNQKNELECGLGHHGNGLFASGHHSKNHPGAINMPHHYSNGCNYSPSAYSYPVSHQNGYAYCHTNGVSEIGDLLQDYLGQGKQMSRKNNGARHVVS